MPVTVQGKLVPAAMNLADQVRVALDVFAYQVECSPHLMPFQYIQQPRCVLWVRTVVKGQRDLAACSFSVVKDFRVATLCDFMEAI